MRVSRRAEAHDPGTQIPEQSVASLHIFDDTFRRPTDEIVRVLRELEGRHDIDVVMITGAGKAFSAGGELAHNLAVNADQHRVVHEMSQAKRVVLKLLECEQLLVCRMNGDAIGYRATLCRCGASKSKPFCDGSHHDAHFSASGEPPTGKADMLAVRDGPLAIDPQPDGPLQVRGNLEIISGTGRVVARVTSARLCRCGGSANKPFCDGTHAKIGFKSS